MLKVRFFKIVLSLLAFAIVLILGNQSLAHEGSEALKAPLFAQPVADKLKSTAPRAPELLEPAFMAKVTASNVTLKWNPSEGADYYAVQLATDPNFKWLAANEVMHKGTTFEAKGLEAGKHYYWRVFAGKSSNDAGYTKSFASKSMFETH